MLIATGYHVSGGGNLVPLNDEQWFRSINRSPHTHEIKGERSLCNVNSTVGSCN